MHGSKPLEELIISYLQKELTNDEERHVIDLISNDDHARLMFEQFSETQRLLQIKIDREQLDVNAEWETCKQNLDSRRPKVISMVGESEIGISKSLKKRSFTLVFKYFAAAAAVLLLCWFSWMYYNPVTNNKVAEMQADHLPVSKPEPLWTKTVNKSGVAKEIKLGDGTLVVLESGSELSYPEPFPENTRPLKLAGEAKFTVVKDPDRPFTITTEFIKTTVLGTIFSVRSYQHENNIYVRLYEGKVMVTPEDTSDVDIKWYMIPGQELLFEKKSSKVTISKFSDLLAAKKVRRKDSTSINEVIELPEKEKGNWFMFNNQPLPEVLDALEIMYHTKIQYRRKDLANLYFIGKYRREDSLVNILKQITKVHGLKLEKNGNDFIVAK